MTLHMSLSTATLRLARDVPQAEQDIDQAILSLTTLMNSMINARHAAGVAPGTGEMAVQHIGKAIEGLVSASGEVAKAHARLRKIHQETATGDVDPCPPAKSFLSEVTQAA